ncbi:hypothetical protein JTB14_029912 [Gonioctena quinquepunctata]|nr:hypothetical protein JTB14_029912 [Gonioctena quinquepunctata]
MSILNIFKSESEDEQNEIYNNEKFRNKVEKLHEEKRKTKTTKVQKEEKSQKKMKKLKIWKKERTTPFSEKDDNTEDPTIGKRKLLDKRKFPKANKLERETDKYTA